MLLQPAKEALIANELIRHSELDVRVSVASCISQIIRITAPDEPYEEDQMKEFFLLANSAFEMLSFMSNTQSCVMMLDLEMYATIGHMLHMSLDGIRCASRVVGRRIKIWWPLDKKFYGGKILCFDDKYKLHQIDYDDGEMEFLDLRRECWKLLKDGNSSAHKQEIGTAPPSSSGAK